MIKPNALERNMIGSIIGAYEKNGWKVVRIAQVLPTRELAELHYEKYKDDKTFYNSMVENMCSGYVIILELEKNYGSIEGAREITLDIIKRNTAAMLFCTSTPSSTIHCSDSEEEAKREIDLWFKYFYHAKTLSW